MSRFLFVDVSYQFRMCLFFWMKILYILQFPFSLKRHTCSDILLMLLSAFRNQDQQTFICFNIIFYSFIFYRIYICRYLCTYGFMCPIFNNLLLYPLQVECICLKSDVIIMYLGSWVVSVTDNHIGCGNSYLLFLVFI